MGKYYKEDLAYIHDVGYRDFALKSAAGILEILDRNDIRGGLIIDLGCGSGLWAEQLLKAGYDVLGIDISGAMIEIARRRVPGARFKVGSLYKARIPSCAAVTSLGECLNYLFDPENDSRAMALLFGRVYDALSPGGVFIFDILEPGQIAPGISSRTFTEGKDWLVLVEKEEDPELKKLTRRIISLRKAGKHYRRSDEMHEVRLYSSTDVARELRQAGFRVRKMASYGGFDLGRAHAAFLARKPE
jgi:SAM-dependent methyltransferase